VVEIKKIAIIPEPVKVNYTDGEFLFTKDTVILSDKNLVSLSKYLKDLLLPATGFDLRTKLIDEKVIDTNSIRLQIIDSNDLNYSEGYHLEITPPEILISAKAPVGVFYGIQTLRQLLPVEFENKKIIENITWKVSCLTIEDHPRFPWRGYMLDEARHFHGKEAVKKILDLMALLKLNKFHWHLTDDQGWRIEIKKYPKLTKIGSKREETQIGGFLNKKTNGVPHSGYYTQEEIQEIISYAKDRFITIIPEIDMPGHTRAALASYNKLSCRGLPFRVSPHWGIHRDVFCIGKEEVFEFVQGVLSEIIELFPGNVVHIGGDEVPKGRWKECTYCQSRIKQEELRNEKDLQVYFTNRITRFLNSKGKRVMGWNQILDTKLEGDVICQYWIRGKHKVLDYLREGGNAIMSNFKYSYLDHSYSFTPLKLAYEFEPIPENLENQYQQHILGLEALMWAEFIPNIKRLEWQTFPRLIAFSEVGWTPNDKKNYSYFKKRLNTLLKRFDLLGVNYAKKKEVNPKLLKRKLGLFSLAQAQKGGT
jgi:hexosaminidase